MRKFLLFFAAFLGIAGGTKSFANDVILTFNKTGQNVTVVVEKHGSKVSGGTITATLVNTNFTTFMNGSSAALSRTTNSVLAPVINTGYGNGLYSTIEYLFKVEGMPSGVEINEAEVDVYAMNSTGASQPNGGSTVRPFDIEIFLGSSDATTEKKGGVSNQDICTVTDYDGGLYHKNYKINTTAYEAPSTMYVKVVLTKKVDAKQGCFAGIGRIKISDGLNFYSQVATNIKPYVDAAADEYFKLTPTGKDAVEAAGYNANTIYYDEDQYKAMLDSLNAYIKLPKTGFYYIRNFTESSNYIYFSNNTLQHSAAKSDYDANYVVQLIKTGDKTYKMSLQGKYVGAQTEGYTAFPCDITNLADAEVFNLGINVGKIGYATFAGQNSIGSGDQAGGLNAGAQGVVNYQYAPANNRSWWTITPATSIERTFDESGYLTLNYPFNIEKPDGVVFYDATDVSGSDVTMTEVSGNKLAANHPVIAYRSAGAGKVTFNITTADGTAKPGNSILYGTLAPAEPTDASKAYILVGNTAANTRFAKLDESNATIAANRAYLSYSSGGSVRELGLNFGVTAIKGVTEGVQKQDGVFDLQGRRVEKPAKGLYIVNGKKVLFN
ncbi:MAG: hypothetical protein SPL64_03055 [Bacteroidaceae bacterium]|nr:hypothetical protein [Bacteroidaceae bacterium]